ncbi:hypothetical protein V5O48_008761 [Marasmius crinis-equi]|uniref:Uncharacterized protein n=1 Tax=Marasmius crinis-equi TaxID=585013 RepID=A0ABR3FD09_9AGAR
MKDQSSKALSNVSGPSQIPGGSLSPSPSQGADASTGGTNTPNTRAIIIGSVVGGTMAIVFLLLLLFLTLRRRRTMQRRSDMAEDVFYKDKMVVERRVSIDGGGAGVGFAQKGKDTRRENMDPDSPTTPLREDFEDRQSAASSLYSAESAAASRVGSGINPALPTIGTTPLETMFGSGRLVESPPPLIPISSSPTPFRTPSRARTDRQMLIEQKILELQGRLITAQGSDQEKTRVRAMLKERIEKVKELRESDWALHEGNSGGDLPDILKG